MRTTPVPFLPARPAVCLLMMVATALLAIAVPEAEAQARFSRISVSSEGAEANGASTDPSISDDGRLVAFTSMASNLVAGTTARSAVFLRDRQTNTTALVSRKADGSQSTDPGPGSFSPHVSATGRFVLFTSYDKLVDEDTFRCGKFGELSCQDAYLHDRQTGETTLVGLTATGESTFDSAGVDVSQDGRFILFESVATNLTPDDPPPIFFTGLYLRDRQAQTTVRIASGQVRAPHMSADGRVVVYQKWIESPDDEDAGQCAAARCSIVFIYDTATRTRARLPIGVDEPSHFSVSRDVPAAISADGRYVAVLRTVRQAEVITQFRALIQDRLSGRSSPFVYRTVPQRLALSPNGRHMVAASDTIDAGWSDLMLYDQAFGTFDAPRLLIPTGAVEIDVDGNGRLVAFSSVRTDLVEGDTNGLSDIFIADRDPDGDGAATWWETAFNLNPDDAADGPADSDGDGKTNAQEYEDGTHPRGAYTRYLAEGAINAFFSTRISLVAGDLNLRPVILRFFGSNGAVTGLLTSATQSPTSFGVVGASPALPGYNTIPLPDDSFSTIVESETPLAVERTMWWGEGRYGAHAETAVAAPSLTWYLAEGATGGPFDLFYLLQNANSTAAEVTIDYLRPSPAAVISKTYTLAPHSRRTIWVNEEDTALDGTDVSAKITADVPLIVERSMYLSRPGQPFAAGLAGAGVTAPATRWFLAEGATGSFFDLYVLVANADSADAQVRLTYLLPDGSHFSADHVVTRQSRRTFLIDTEDPRLENTPVSIIAESTNGVPIVVERTMWWPEGNWYEAHLSAGATVTGTTFALAEGEVERGNGTETYVLIANTSPTAGSATVTLRTGFGDTLERSVALPANSRVTVRVSELFPDVSGHFATHVVSDGVQIVVEGATYMSTPDTPWSAGTNLLATRLQ